MLSRKSFGNLIFGGGLVWTIAAFGHGNVTPQPVDTGNLPDLGIEALEENPFREGNEYGHLNAQAIEIINYAQGYNIKPEEAKIILDQCASRTEQEWENGHKLPFEKLAQIQKSYTSVGFGDDHHSADFVELAAFGPGSELLPPFVENVFLHNMMLQACGVNAE